MFGRQQTLPSLCNSAGVGSVKMRREKTLCDGPSGSLTSVPLDTPRTGFMKLWHLVGHQPPYQQRTRSEVVSWGQLPKEVFQ